MSKPFDPTKPVQTRDGRPARIICTDRKGGDPIIALVAKADGCENAYSCSASGRYRDGETSPHDLINIPQKREGWVNLYRFRFGVGVGSVIFPTEDTAIGDGRGLSSRIRPIATARIEWEE